MFAKRYILWLYLAGTLACGHGLRAQSTGAQPDKPIPPDSIGGASDNAANNPDEIFPIDQPKLTPDTRPLAGAQALTLGTVNKSYNFILPSFSVVAQGGYSSYSPSSTSGSNTTFGGFAAGRLALNHVSTYSSILLDYLAAGSFSQDSSLGNSVIQSLSIAYTFQRGRWTTMLGDQLSYTPASPFGFGGLGGLDSLGIGLGNGVGYDPGFLPNYVPNQTLFLDGASRLSNSVIAQDDYALTHRSSLTFVGSYGVLKFFNAGFEDGNSVSFQAGYNYALSRKDSIAVAYQFGRFAFFNAPTKIMTHAAIFSYSRRVTGRMSFQVGGGPQAQVFDEPGTNNQTAMNWTLQSGLSYEIGRTALSASYSHSQTGGSGLFIGAETDTITGSANRRLNRSWAGSMSVGYARNQTLKQTTPTGYSANPETWFAAVQVSRQFFRYGSVSLSYGFSHESSLLGFCTLPSCTASTSSQFISVSYTWGLRPLVL